MLHKVEAVVIRSMDYGEGNKIITLYTKERGKVGVMARGAKKVKSRHSSITQLFVHGEFTYYKSGQMGNLNHADIIHSFQGLREDIYKTAYSAYVVEMIDRILNENEGSSYIFDQLIASLEAINVGKDLQVITHLFEMKMLRMAGYSPVLDECVHCEESGEHLSLSIDMGGILCTKCRTVDASPILIQPKTLKLLRIFQTLDITRLGKIEVSAETKAELKHCMRQFMDTHVSSYWKSRGFLDQMDKYNLI